MLLNKFLWFDIIMDDTFPQQCHIQNWPYLWSHWSHNEISNTCFIQESFVPMIWMLKYNVQAKSNFVALSISQNIQIHTIAQLFIVFNKKVNKNLSTDMLYFFIVIWIHSKESFILINIPLFSDVSHKLVICIECYFYIYV